MGALYTHATTTLGPSLNRSGPLKFFQIRGIHWKLLIWCGGNNLTGFKASMLYGELSNRNLISFIHRYLGDTRSS